MGCLCLGFFEPILTIHLVDLGMSETNAGYGVSTNCFTYAFGAILAGCLCSVMNRRYVMLWSCLLCALSLFLVGPCGLIGLPEKPLIIFIGLAFLGVGCAGITVPIMPEMI
jgi:MFS family permease